MGFIAYSIGATLTVLWSASAFDDRDMWLSVFPLVAMFWPLIVMAAVTIKIIQRLTA